MFDSETYIERRKKLKESVSSGIIFLPGNEESPMNFEHNVYPFRQDSSFLYFVGLDRAGLACVIDIDEGKEIVFGDDLSMEEIIWMGKRPSINEESLKTGISSTLPVKELPGILESAKKAGRKVHYLPPYRADNKSKISELLDISIADVDSSASKELIKRVVALRSIKSDDELAEIDEAVNISRDMHLASMFKAKEGVKEYEVLAEIEKAMTSSKGRFSFPAIVTVRGEVLHNNYYGNTLESGMMLLTDLGAETDVHYAGDITRTIPVDIKFTERQKEIYKVVLDSQSEAIMALKPGIRYLDVHLLAAMKIASGLKEIGLILGDAEEAVYRGAHTLFFPHGLGHMMGLDVHDMEDLGEDYVGYDDEVKRSTELGLKSLRLGRELEPGFVLTVEPGIYFIPELMDMWKSENKLSEFINYEKLEEYRDFGGIRIEDDYAITEGGAKLLGNPIPKEIEDIEEIRSF